MSMPSDEEIRRRVEKRIKERNEFYIHLAVYIIANIMLWIMWGFTSDLFSAILSGGGWDYNGLPWPIFPTMGWGIGIVAHGLTVYFNSPGRIEARERTIQREIERERQRLASDDYYEKPKRDRHVRLTDDGELIEIEDTEKRKHDR
jgi:hypothetical protein